MSKKDDDRTGVTYWRVKAEKVEAEAKSQALNALAALGQAADTLADAKKAETRIAELEAERDEANRRSRTYDAANGKLIAERDRLRGALSDLLDDTQHVSHICGDEWCPVARARAALNEGGK